MKIINKNIDMICWFDKDGIPHPFRLRLTTQEGANVVIQIHRVVKRHLEKLAGNKMMVFTCQSVIHHQERLFVLKYELDTCKWFLFKI